MYKVLLKDTAIYGLSDFLLKILAFISFPIFTHLLSLSDYGVMSLVSTIGSFAGLFLNIGISNAIQRYYFSEEFSDQKAKVTLLSTGYILLLSWSLFVSALFILATFLFKDSIKESFEILYIYILFCLLSNIPLQLIQYSSDVLRLKFSPWKFTILSGVKNLSGILLSIVFLYFYKSGLIGYFWANLLAPLIFIPYGIFLIRNDLKFQFDKAIAWKILKFGYPFLYAGIAYWLFSSVDRWMLGEMTNNNEVGIYSVAMRFGALMLFVGSAFGTAWSPYALKIHSEGENYQKIYGNILSYYLLIGTLIGSALCLFIKEFLILFTPFEFWSAAQSSYFLVMGVLIYTTTYITQIGISLKNKTHLLSILSWLATLLNLILNYFLIPYFGSLGASIATFITYIALSYLYLFYTQRLDPINVNYKSILFSFSIIVCTILFAFLIESNEISALIIFYKIGYLLFLLAMSYLLRIIDIKAIYSLLKK